MPAHKVRGCARAALLCVGGVRGRSGGLTLCRDPSTAYINMTLYVLLVQLHAAREACDRQSLQRLVRPHSARTLYACAVCDTKLYGVLQKCIRNLLGKSRARGARRECAGVAFVFTRVYRIGARFCCWRKTRAPRPTLDRSFKDEILIMAPFRRGRTLSILADLVKVRYLNRTKTFEVRAKVTHLNTPIFLAAVADA